MEFLLYFSVILYLCGQAVFLKFIFSEKYDFNLKNPSGYELEKMNIDEDYNIDLSRIKELKFLKFKKLNMNLTDWEVFKDNEFNWFKAYRR